MVRSEGDMSLKNPVTPPGIDPETFRLVAQRLNHYATPGPRAAVRPLQSLIILTFVHDQHSMLVCCVSVAAVVSRHCTTASVPLSIAERY